MKANTKPFWSIIGLLICLLCMQITVVVLLSHTVNGFPVARAVRSIILQMILTSVVLVAEAIVYRVIRFRLYRPLWAWAHVSCLYFVVLILPIFIVLLNFFVRRKYTSWDQFEWIRRINLLRTFLFWSFILIGHLFFVLTIVKAFSKKAEPRGDNNESSDLLDEFPS